MKLVLLEGMLFGLVSMGLVFPALSKFFFGGVASLCSPDVGKVVLAAGRVAIVWLLLLFFARKRIFLKV